MGIEKDKLVKQLMDKVAIKKEEIAKAEKPTWLTNKSFRYDLNSGSALNLNTVNDTEKLVETLSILLEKEGSYKKAAEVLDHKGEFKWFGYTVEEWKSDFITRKNKIQLTDKKKELEMIQSKLDKLVSKEERERMELEAIAKMLED